VSTSAPLALPVPHAATGPAGKPSWVDGLRYGALGAPLAFAALPLYVQLPNHYAAKLGAPLAGLGLVLLATRALDALIDPWLGRWSDRLLQQPRSATWRWAALAAMLLAVGLVALFFPPRVAPLALLTWCGLALLVTSLGYSSLGVLHQSWGARMGGSAAAQARIVGWREGLSLAGVLLASVVPALAGVAAMVVVAVLLLGLGLLALARAPYPAGLAAAAGSSAGEPAAPAAALPWQQPAFRRLIGVFLVNGVASAVPATLVLFYVRDRLQAPAFEALFLGAYFATAALAVPLWVRAMGRVGLVNCWLVAMLLAVASFIWAATLGPGDVVAFALVCAASGVALGADLVAPGALLTGVVQRAGHGQQHEGRYFGWWTCAAKLNLALAAGLALPMLQALGYRPGSQDPAALQALSLAYALLPCLLKLGAALLLWRYRDQLESR
jgi:glycoside/pentoside/hexuronide:cation symporter, GPH family